MASLSEARQQVTTEMDDLIDTLRRRADGAPPLERKETREGEQPCGLDGVGTAMLAPIPAAATVPCPIAQATCCG